MVTGRFPAPIFVESLQLHPCVFHIFRQSKRAGTYTGLALLIQALHIHNAGIRVTQAIRQRRIGLPGRDPQRISLCFHGGDVQFLRRTALQRADPFQRSLHRFRIHGIPTLKFDAVRKFYGPGQAIRRNRIVLNQIFLYVQIFIQPEQRFHHADPHVHPGIRTGCRIHRSDIVTENEAANCCRVLHFHAAVICTASGEAQHCQRCQKPYDFLLHASLLLRHPMPFACSPDPAQNAHCLPGD